MSTFNYQSAAELISSLANKKVSSVELVEAAIERIEKYDAKINAVVVHDFDEARKAAVLADEALARGERLPLLGLPITVKESFNIAGLPTNWGNPQFKDARANEDALSVSRLKVAGAIILGKTNVPFMLSDYQSYNAIYGVCNNPWDLALTPGGSSGGSAAALAAGYVSLELGSDFAGSLRVPAHCCGVFAHKPSVNLIPVRGHSIPGLNQAPSVPAFGVMGPMARTAKDLELALSVLAGPDELTEGKAYKLNLPAARFDKLSDFRVLVLDTHPLFPTANVIQKSLHKFVEQLQKLRVKVSQDVSLVPDLVKTAQTFATLIGSSFSDRIPPELYQKIVEDLKNTPDLDTLSLRVSRGFSISHREWGHTMTAQFQLQREWRNVFKHFDLIICPVMPALAFAHDHSADFNKRTLMVDGVHMPFGEQFIWSSIATLAGLPSTAMPINSEANLPIGVQIIGNYLEDLTTIKFAELAEKELGGFVAPEMDF